MGKIKNLYKKYEEIINYIIFGFITTVASLAACFLTLKFGVLIWHDEAGEPTEFLDILGSTVQWVVGVLVAFVTNKKWVFKSCEGGKKRTAHEFFAFCGSRVFTYFLEVVVNLASIAIFDACGYNDISFKIFAISIALSSRLWAKVISSVVVTVSNYFISKLFVFKKKKD